MSILGVIVRTRPADRPAVAAELRALPGTDVALEADDGRLILVLEDAEDAPAADTLARIALWPRVLNTSLVYETSEIS